MEREALLRTNLPAAAASAPLLSEVGTLRRGVRPKPSRALRGLLATPKESNENSRG
jgi:hypothetical protein